MFLLLLSCKSFPKLISDGADYCQKQMWQPPVWNIMSDRRGGRTAWSATVEIGGVSVSARYWYDGVYLGNAKEDAAEVALRLLHKKTLQTMQSV